MTFGISWQHEHTDEHLDRGLVTNDGQPAGEMRALRVGVLQKEYVATDLEGRELGRSLLMYDALKFFS